MIRKELFDIGLDDPVLMKLGQIFGLSAQVLAPHHGARRNLFGSDISDPLPDMSDEMSRRSAADWNFDFSAGAPLAPGRFQWECVFPCAPAPPKHTISSEVGNPSKCNKPGKLLPASIKSLKTNSPITRGRSCRQRRRRLRPLRMPRTAALSSATTLRLRGRMLRRR